MTSPLPSPGKTLAWTIAFTSLMSITMATAIFSSTVLGVISPFLIEDLEITRTQLGWLAGVVSITAATLGPSTGKIADRIGGRSTAAAVFVISGLGLLAMSASPTYAILLLAGLLAGIGQSGANPSTNKLIRLHVAPHQRGIITGIKQSGVQLGLVLGGLIVPGLAISFGWRTVLASTALVPVAGVIVTILLVPRDNVSDTGSALMAQAGAPLPNAIRQMAVQGVLIGMSVATFVTFLPLYTEEQLGSSVTTAGFVAGAYAISGLSARLVITGLGARSTHLARPMLLVTGLSIIGIVMVWFGSFGGMTFVWIGAALVGTQVAWTALAMLDVVTRVPNHQAGRASGVISRGFGFGLALGPPIFGFSVDATGSYHLGFLFPLTALVTAGVLIRRWEKSDPVDQGVAGLPEAGI